MDKWEAILVRAGVPGVTQKNCKLYEAQIKVQIN